jgi:CRISPR system Cascade subunit CasA
MPSYNLTERSWIPVLLKDGTSTEVSLLGAIEGASGIARISGNPLEAAVLHRLLLAIALRVSAPKDPGEWLKLWADRGALMHAMSNYLRANTEAFDLYSRERPFAQNPRLPPPTRTPAELVYERARGNNPVFLDGSVVADPKTLSSDQAARSLLVAHAFGGSGTGGLNPLNGNKKDTMYAGPLCARMIALLEGEDLSETLLLNLTVGQKAGQPCWERTQKDTPMQTRPEGLCDLYTRATRNILLEPSPDGEYCERVVIAMGESVLSEEGSDDDPLIPRYFSKVDKKFKALRVNPAKALWRNSQVLLVPEATDVEKPLASIALLRVLIISRGAMKERGEIRLRAIGVAANAQGPVTDLWLDESLSFSLGLFSPGNGYQSLLSLVEKAESEANTLRRQLSTFAARYVSNGGGSPDPKDLSRLIEEICPGLNSYWMSLAPEGERLALDPPEPEAWNKRVVKVRQRAYQEAIDQLPVDGRRLRAQFSQQNVDDKEEKRKKEKQTI